MSKFESAQHEQAAEWFATFQEQELSMSTLEQWERWIAEPENRRSYTAIVGLWSQGDRLGPMIPPDARAVAADNYDGSEPLATWFRRPGESPPENEAAKLPEPRARRRWNRLISLAAALAVIAIWGGIYTEPWWRFTESTQQYYTGTGEHRTVTLPDGSIVDLGARSALRVQLTKERRSVFLDEGEAFFKVAKDPVRPFAVQAGVLQLSALGTAFNVRKATERVVVSVQEGKVRVSPSQKSDTSGTVTLSRPGARTPPRYEVLTKGQQVGYDAFGLRTVTSINPEDISSWRNGRLQYLYAPLEEVIGDINRYSRRQVILDERASELHFTGTVFQANVEDFINQITDIFPLQIESDGDQLVLRLRNPDIGIHH